MVVAKQVSPDIALMCHVWSPEDRRRTKKKIPIHELLELDIAEGQGAERATAQSGVAAGDVGESDDDDVLEVYDHGQSSASDSNVPNEELGLLEEMFVQAAARESSEAAREGDHGTEAHGAALSTILPAAVLKKPGAWGVFRMSLKQPSTSHSKYGGYEITCPYHKKRPRTLCKKYVSLQSPTDSDKQVAICKARHWAVRANEYGTQRQHVFDCPLVAPPAVATLETMRAALPEVPALVFTDAEIAVQEKAQAKTKAKAKGKAAQKRKAEALDSAPASGLGASSSSTGPAAPDVAPESSGNSESDSSSSSSE